MPPFPKQHKSTTSRNVGKRCVMTAGEEENICQETRPREKGTAKSAAWGPEPEGGEGTRGRPEAVAQDQQEKRRARRSRVGSGSRVAQTIGAASRREGRARGTSGPETDTSAGASGGPARGPDHLQAPPPPPPPPPLTDSASSPHSSPGRPGPSRGASTGPARASSTAPAAASAQASGCGGKRDPSEPKVARPGPAPEVATEGTAPSPQARSVSAAIASDAASVAAAAAGQPERDAGPRRQPPATRRKRAGLRHVTGGWAPVAPPDWRASWEAGREIAT
ncbi:skin secretory protein xP2-like [Sorex fumeus]|uniref:skin secretory protein xP2-like n=1 Tax=Sorex fumeus TaxID=62283 RepID=UPI0024ADB174|nr:skin secretory protein xP2-like [Sorex fumeus]